MHKLKVLQRPLRVQKDARRCKALRTGDKCAAGPTSRLLLHGLPAVPALHLVPGDLAVVVAVEQREQLLLP